VWYESRYEHVGQNLSQMFNTDNGSHRGTAESNPTHRVLAEGPRPLLKAAKDAGLNDKDALPSLRTLLRAAISGQLDAVKVAGRWLTSPAAIVRWIDAAQHRRVQCLPILSATVADEVLAPNGLQRHSELGEEA
jgi:hypothetical protein